jgi:peptide/nickel transport system substrate-binding protein
MLSTEFVAAPDLSTQRRLAGEIERLLFEETLIIYAYFYDTPFASQKNISGAGPAPTWQLLLWNAVKT